MSLDRLRGELASATRAEIYIIKCRDFEERLREDASGPTVQENLFPLHPYGTMEPIVRRIPVPAEDVPALAAATGKAVSVEAQGAFCHEAPVGLRFWRGDTLIWETTISFVAGNAQLPFPWPDARLGGAPSTQWTWAGLGADANGLMTLIGRLAPEAVAGAPASASPAAKAP